MKVTRATLILNPQAADYISLLTDLPEASWPYKGFQSVTMHCAQGKGEEYLAQHFPGVPVEIVGRGTAKIPHKSATPRLSSCTGYEGGEPCNGEWCCANRAFDLMLAANNHANGHHDGCLCASCHPDAKPV